MKELIGFIAAVVIIYGAQAARGCAEDQTPPPTVPPTPIVEVRYPKRWVEEVKVVSTYPHPTCWVLLEEVNRYDMWTTDIKGFQCEVRPIMMEK